MKCADYTRTALADLSVSHLRSIGFGSGPRSAYSARPRSGETGSVRISDLKVILIIFKSAQTDKKKLLLFLNMSHYLDLNTHHRFSVSDWFLG